MNLDSMVENIALAKQDNARWLQHVNNLLQGHAVEKDAIPDHHETCSAYQWLYDHAREIDLIYRAADCSEFDLVEFDIIDQIEIMRYELRAYYLQVFRHCFSWLNNSFFAKLFHLHKSVSKCQMEEAEILVKEMENVVSELDGMLDHLEGTLKRVCDLNTA